MKSLPLFLAWRFLFAGSERGYLSVISWFSLIGMALGVAALIVVSSVMNGFEKQLQDRILSIVPHIFVEPKTLNDPIEVSKISSIPGVVGVAPYRKIQAMVSYDGYISGVTLNGVEPETFNDVSLVPDHMVVGTTDILDEKTYRVIIGAGVSRQLGVYVGDKISIVLPQVTLTPAGAFPRSRRFTVAGVFQAGADVDETEIYIHLSDMLRLERKKPSQAGVRVEVDDVLTATQISPDIQVLLGDSVVVSDWSQTHGSLFQAVKVEKLMVALLLSIIIFVAAFNVVAVLTMMVINKRSAIAVLRTIGASQRLVLSTFVGQGILLGCVGTLAGVLLGLPIALFLNDIMTVLGLSLFDANVYYITALPSLVNASHVAVVIAFALSISLLATIYPAYRATRIHPSEVLRYE